MQKPSWAFFSLMAQKAKPNLKIENLHVSADGIRILNGVDLVIKPGEVHALMGPNGSGKSTLALALAGHPGYKITKGKVFLGRKDIAALDPEDRAKAGLFLAFQHPVGTEGVSVFNFVKTAMQEQGRKLPPSTLLKDLKKISEEIGLDEDFLRRSVNVSFSGGEKKRSEVLQAMMLSPRFPVFDEIDSGLDVDALRLIAQKISALAKGGSGILVITHYQRILQHLKPDFVHVMVGGKIAESGDAKLAVRLEKRGYKDYK